MRANGASSGTRWRARGTIDWRCDAWEAGVAMQYVGPSGRHADLTYQKPYRPVNVRLAWNSPTRGFLRGTRFDLGVDDIFQDTIPLYADPPIGYNAYVVSRPQQRFWRVAATRRW